MPRRNRRSEGLRPATKVRILSAHERRHLAVFAAEHLDSHVMAVWGATRDGHAEAEVCTFSVHDLTGTRFASHGATFDPAAVRLADALKSSDATGNVAA